MSDLLQVTIDLTEAGLGLAGSELEQRSLLLADELRAGKLATDARLARQEELPEGAKAGLLAFIGGLLTAEISRENLKKTLDFLGNQFYGKVLRLEYEADGLKCAFDYRNPQEMAQALTAIKELQAERLSAVQIRILESGD